MRRQLHDPMVFDTLKIALHSCDTVQNNNHAENNASQFLFKKKHDSFLMITNKTQHQVSKTLGHINSIALFKPCKTRLVRSSKQKINTGLKRTTRTVSHLLDPNCPLPEPSVLVAVQHEAHCSMSGNNFPC